jgi:hypothetical protein
MEQGHAGLIEISFDPEKSFGTFGIFFATTIRLR